MAGFTLRDSAEFDDWQLFQAESLRQELSEVLEKLVSLHSTAGDWEGALPHARRWVALDATPRAGSPMPDAAVRPERKAGLGLKQYETLRQTLDRELGVEPDAETRQAL